MLKILFGASVLLLGACAAPPERPTVATPQTGLDASALLSELTRVAALSPDSMGPPCVRGLLYVHE